ncbi:hypothetical protein V5F77_10340 [Xanthobacter sp. DSM 24535]|uniref:hypothetical protein n=1 Tax=Roseixanthobacter psychrophilus TaxID=3119917 RepID=UPI003729C18F
MAAVEAVAGGFHSIDVDGYADDCEAVGRMDLRPIQELVRLPTPILAEQEDPAAHLLAVGRPEGVAAELRRALATSFPQQQNM